MPNRIVREGILTSEPVNSLDWAEEIFYRRLLSVVDDYGRYSADPRLLLAALYPLKLGSVSVPDVGKWLSKVSAAGLVREYSAEGKAYLEVTKFNQQCRAKRSKYPSPDNHPPSVCAADDKHLRTQTNKRTVEGEGASGNEGEGVLNHSDHSAGTANGVSESAQGQGVRSLLSLSNQPNTPQSIAAAGQFVRQASECKTLLTKRGLSKNVVEKLITIATEQGGGNPLSRIHEVIEMCEEAKPEEEAAWITRCIQRGWKPNRRSA